MQDFYCKSEITEAKQSIIIEIDDNKKLTLKDYRELIYNLVEQDEAKMMQNRSGLSESSFDKA
jgi:hypothetical protein